MTVNPFDTLKAALEAKGHAQHVVLIHFPIALFLAAVAFDWLWRSGRRTGRWRPQQYFNSAAGRDFHFAGGCDGLGLPLGNGNS